MQKEIKCAFDILKRRFRILSIPIPLQNIKAVNQIWKTCCTLHNWLSKIDGLDVKWDAAGCSDDDDNDDGNTSVPLPSQCLIYGICVCESCAGDEKPTAGTQATT